LKYKDLRLRLPGDVIARQTLRQKLRDLDLHDTPAVQADEDDPA
jgi:hypothetical protein